MRGTRETRRERRGVVMRAGASTFRDEDEDEDDEDDEDEDDDDIVSRRKTLAFALAVMTTATPRLARARTG